MQRWIEQANARWQTIEGSEDPLEVLLLVRQKLGQCRFASVLGLGQNHLPNGDDPIPFEEHVLGAAKSNPLGAKSNSVEDLIGLIRIGAEPQRSVLVG